MWMEGKIFIANAGGEKCVWSTDASYIIYFSVYLKDISLLYSLYTYHKNTESYISFCSVWNKEFMLICIASYKRSNLFQSVTKKFCKFALYVWIFSSYNTIFYITSVGNIM